ncbi:hypothetical protein GCM10017767_15770 [Halomonas urumqiensis]|nr:hypothetical protein GCM10017767_15770 [Halomonas urumqiensis]
MKQACCGALNPGVLRWCLDEAASLTGQSSAIWHNLLRAVSSANALAAATAGPAKEFGRVADMSV